MKRTGGLSRSARLTARADLVEAGDRRQPCALLDDITISAAS